jgi:hypothetical protein
VKRGLRGLGIVVGLLVAWGFADLYFRIDLPGAGRLQHLAFRAVTDALQWLDVDRSRIQPVALAAGGVAVASVVLGRRGAILQRGIAAMLCAPVVVTLVVAALMERAIFAGWVVGCVVLHARKQLVGAPQSGWRTSMVSGAIGAGLGIGALIYLFFVVAADSSGYSLPEQLRILERAGGFGAREAFLVVAAALTVGAGAWSLRAGRAGLEAVVLGIVIAAFGSTDGTRITTILGASAAIASTAVLGPVLLGSLATQPWETRRWPGAALLPGLIAAFLFSHTYTSRLFHCPDELPPYLTQIADPAEVFSTALNGDGSVAALSLRAERRLGRVVEPAGPGPHALEPADPGPIPAPPPDGNEPPGTTYATVEELVPAPEVNAFFATALAGHTEFYSLPESPPSTVNNLVVRMRGDGTAADEVFWEGHLCWIGTLAWDGDKRRLYMGCEYDPQIHRLDFDTKTIEAATTDPRLGDVAGIAIDAERGRLYTVSLWDSDQVTELDRETLQIVRQRRIGGTHYALEYDQAGGRLFAPAFYGSRVRIVDVESLDVVGLIRTGLGPRAMAFVPGDPDLLLAAAVYDDLLRICDPKGAVLKTVRVGGHVKSIAIDSDRRLAYFWSQCGLFRLDLDAALAN